MAAHERDRRALFVRPGVQSYRSGAGVAERAEAGTTRTGLNKAQMRGHKARSDERKHFGAELSPQSAVGEHASLFVLPKVSRARA